MKKMLLGFATCALMLSSCAKNETYTNVSQGNEIGFGVLNNRLTAKAANDQSGDYRVFATFSEASFASKYYMNVVVNGSNNDYNPKAVWPNFNSGVDTLTFYAFAPASVMGVPAWGFDGTHAYTVPADGQEDLTVAAPSAHTAKPTNGEVLLQFEHMLSAVKIGSVDLAQSLKDAGYSIVSTDAKIRLYVTSNGGTTKLKDPTEAWSNPTGSGQFYQDHANYFIMPQSIPDDATFKIQLSGVEIKDNAGSDILVTTESIKIAYIPRAATSTGAFVKGVRYNVNFIIGTDAKKPGTDADDPTDEGPAIFNDFITFNPSVTDWVEEYMGFDLGVSTSVTSNLPTEFTDYIAKVNAMTGKTVTARFNISGALAADYTLDASTLVTGLLSGSKLTIDASTITDANWTDGKALTITVPSGWTASPAATITKTDKLVVLTKD